jgi:hypothetical protein
MYTKAVTKIFADVLGPAAVKGAQPCLAQSVSQAPDRLVELDSKLGSEQNQPLGTVDVETNRVLLAQALESVGV